MPRLPNLDTDTQHLEYTMDSFIGELVTAVVYSQEGHIEGELAFLDRAVREYSSLRKQLEEFNRAIQLRQDELNELSRE